jgi:nicotinamide riboside kinase
MKSIVTFTGSVSTGKTTLLHLLKGYVASNHYKVSVITEFVRELKEAGVIKNNDIDGDNNTQVMITCEQMLQYFERLFDDSQVVIAERTPIDILAYSRHSNCSESIIESAERYLRAFLNMKNSHNLFIFYLPPVIPFESDNVRVEEGREIIDKEILNILSEFNIKHFKVTENDLHDRFEFIRNILNI